MKRPCLASLVAAALLAWGGCQTASNNPHGKVVINYDYPEKFTDMRLTYNGPTEQGYMDSLRRHLEIEAGQYIPVGQTLTITFTNVDMAGDFNLRLGDVRTIRSIYPLKLNFTYTVTDASAKAVKSGTEELINSFPGSQMGFDRGDPLFHEKEEMDSWIRKTLR